MKIKILLVEDYPVIREGFRALLENQPELEVVGEADNGAAAVEQALRLHPHVVIMDITLRGSEMTGIKATQKITSLHHEIKVIALSESEDGARIKGMIAAGASGYLSKGCTSDELMAAIQTVMQGKCYFSVGGQSGGSGRIREFFAARSRAKSQRPDRARAGDRAPDCAGRKQQNDCRRPEDFLQNRGRPPP